MLVGTFSNNWFYATVHLSETTFIILVEETTGLYIQDNRVITFWAGITRKYTHDITARVCESCLILF